MSDTPHNTIPKSCGTCRYVEVADASACRDCAAADNWVCRRTFDDPRAGDAHQTLTFRPPGAFKETNPKDAIGIHKAPMSTVSAAVLAEVGVAMLEGASKYGRHNYRVSGVRASVYYDAAMRHLMGWWEGEDTDPDSGMSHVTKAITSLVVLRDAMIQGMCTDDRPPRSAEFYTALNDLAAQVLARHADKTPRHYTIADHR